MILMQGKAVSKESMYFLHRQDPAVSQWKVEDLQAEKRATGIRIGICGELGGDIRLLQTFLTLGLDERSIAPSYVLSPRAEIRKSIAKTCTLEKPNC